MAGVQYTIASVVTLLLVMWCPTPAHAVVTASAGPDRVVLSTTVQLSASGTSDQPPLTFKWTVTAGPAGSSFDDDTSSQPTVTLGGNGAFTFEVTVTNAALEEDTATVDVYYPQLTVDNVAATSFIEPLADMNASPEAYNSLKYNTFGFPAGATGNVWLVDSSGVQVAWVRSLDLDGQPSGGLTVNVDFSHAYGEGDTLFLAVDFVTTAPEVRRLRAMTNSFNLRRRNSWVAGLFGVCQYDSGTCGMGFQERTLTCTDLVSNTAQLPRQCRLAVQPAAVQLCSTPCATNYYVYEDWGACDADCGGGFQTRTVYCVDPFGSNASAVCTTARPRRFQECNKLPCPVYSWNYTAWGDCSASCGSGTQTRAAYCADTSGRRVPDSNCVLADLGVTSRACNDQDCGDHWSLGAWGACSAPTCGGGTQTRSVTCVTSAGSLQSDAVCSASSTKPATSRTCNSQPCSVSMYVPSAWGSCGAGSSCGGTRTRSVACATSDGTALAANTSCLAFPTPAASQQCQACGICHRRDPATTNICTGRGDCHANEDVCLCDVNYLGDYCHIQLGCAGVLDDKGQCCVGVLNADMSCCVGVNAVIDSTGACCESGVVDACGVCQGSGKAVDARGVCCTTSLDAQGLCCDGVVDECGVCNGFGATCIPRVALDFTVPAKIDAVNDLLSVETSSYAVMAADMVAHADAKTAETGSQLERFEYTPARRLGLRRELAGETATAVVKLGSGTSGRSVATLTTELVSTTGDVTVTALKMMPAAGQCGNNVCEFGEQCDVDDPSAPCCASDCPVSRISCAGTSAGECNGAGRCIVSPKPAKWTARCDCYTAAGYTGVDCGTCAKGFFHPKTSASVCIRLATASCNDGVKNGDEEGVDCGAACEISCVVNTVTEDGIQSMWGVFGGSLILLMLIICFLACHPMIYKRKLERPYRKVNASQRRLDALESARVRDRYRHANTGGGGGGGAPKSGATRGAASTQRRQPARHVEMTQFTGSNPMYPAGHAAHARNGADAKPGVGPMNPVSPQ